ncbi:MAG: hypothetical protein ACFFDN_34280 [Candidatus Hodarchaeota archaeon]
MKTLTGWELLELRPRPKAIHALIVTIIGIILLIIGIIVLIKYPDIYTDIDFI